LRRLDPKRPYCPDARERSGRIRRDGKLELAAGRVVAPGFIDHHTHFDPQAVWDPYCGSWVHNGHTTVVVGQCGQVIAPVRPGDVVDATAVIASVEEKRGMTFLGIDHEARRQDGEIVCRGRSLMIIR